MIDSAHDYFVSQLFDTASSVVYEIPRYQREYTWGRLQWEAFFDDLLENDSGYFLGSIICINHSKDVLSIQRLEVVDGQQRLTTLSLLFAAIYQVLRKRESDLDADQKNELFNLKRRLVLKGDEQTRIVPQIQNSNLQDYRAMLAETGILLPVDMPSYTRVRKIFRAFQYFQDRISQMTLEKSDPLAAIAGLLGKVTQATLVKIEVGSHADAYTLFESLNNRGTPLTAVDLIKNKLLGHLENLEPGKIDYYFGRWNQLLGYLGDDYTIQERFFRQYYNAFREELKEVYQVPVATRSNVMQIYEKLITNDANAFLDSISAAGRLYALLLFRNQDDALKELQKPLKDLERIQGAPAYLLMLYLLVYREQLQLGPNALADIVRVLVRFFVRRNLTDTPPTRDLTRLFMTIIEKLAAESGQAIVGVIRNQLESVSADDSVFRSRLEGPIYEENAGVTRFVLCALAEQGMTKESWVDLWKFEDRQNVWTIEHIFPQGENLPQEWVNMIADGKRQEAKAYQQSHVHKLGNLTISGFNSTLGNKSFQEKRDRKDKQGLAVGYRNGLKLNEDLANSPTWSVALIDARTTKLVDQAMALFRMDGH